MYFERVGFRFHICTRLLVWFLLFLREQVHELLEKKHDTGCHTMLLLYKVFI